MALSIIPASTLSTHPAHHGNITGEEANEALRRRGAPSYLMRFSEIKQKHILSLATGEDTFEHYGLSEENHQYTLDRANKSFSSIDELLEYYENAPIDPTKPNTHIGRPCFKDLGTNNPQPTHRRPTLRQPMQTVREEPAQSEMMIQSIVLETNKSLMETNKNLVESNKDLMETNKNLVKFVEERCAKQDEMYEKMSERMAERMAERNVCVIS